MKRFILVVGLVAAMIELIMTISNLIRTATSWRDRENV